jgi:hypothetical protein
VTNQDALLAVLITAASDVIQEHCRRAFLQASYEELYSGNGDRRLMLRQYPLISVESVRYRPVTVLKITNTIAANVQARVSVTSTGLKLVRVNNGVKTTDTRVTFAPNVTLAAVNALGNGWSAQVVGDATNYGSWPSADLYARSNASSVPSPSSRCTPTSLRDISGTAVDGCSGRYPTPTPSCSILKIWYGMSVSTTYASNTPLATAPSPKPSRKPPPSGSPVCITSAAAARCSRTSCVSTPNARSPTRCPQSRVARPARTTTKHRR